ncbi:MAG: LLM class F420-dependent oxidoreductase [Nitrospinae bacterium]|nr:LLM class F420-dependent oxidoreductase [Nitrospinota bacterium]
MDFGVHMFGVGALADPDALSQVARRAEELGYHSVFVADHVLLPTHIASKYPYTADGHFPFPVESDWIEPLTALAYLAAETTRIRIGTSILVLPYRNPLVTAKQLASIDRMAKGRLIIGVGTGWLEEEFRLLGVPKSERGVRTDEYLALMKVLWTEEAPRFAGRFFQVADARFFPKPLQKPHPPLWVGGESTPALKRAATLGDGWHSASCAVEELPHKLAQLQALRSQAGRPWTGFTISIFPSERLTLELVQRLEGMGVQHVMSPVYHSEPSRLMERLERFAREVVEPANRT